MANETLMTGVSEPGAALQNLIALPDQLDAAGSAIRDDNGLGFSMLLSSVPYQD